MKIDEIKGKVDFGIITIREDEYCAIIDRFPKKCMVNGGRDYYISEAQSSLLESYTIAIVRCAEQGNGEAQAVADDLIRDLDPQWILLVGICGAVPAYEFSLGDVVLSIRLHDFCIQAMIEGRETEFAITGGPMHRAVQNYISALHGRKEELGEWNSEESIKMKQPIVNRNEEKFYGSAQWRKKAKEVIEKRFGLSVASRQPLFTAASVASSDSLIKDTNIVQSWKNAARDIAAVEMELAGVYRAARKAEREYPVLAIRGISDIVGYERDPDWTAYACNSAAAFAKALITAPPITPRRCVQPAKSPQIQTVYANENGIIKFLDEAARKGINPKIAVEKKLLLANYY